MKNILFCCSQAFFHIGIMSTISRPGHFILPFILCAMNISGSLLKLLLATKSEIDKHPDRRYHISEINFSGRTDKYYAKAFRHTFGETFYQYQIKAAMFYASSLLHAGDSVKSVSISLGYESLKSFSRAYKKYYGINPSVDRPSNS